MRMNLYLRIIMNCKKMVYLNNSFRHILEWKKTVKLLELIELSSYPN